MKMFVSGLIGRSR